MWNVFVIIYSETKDAFLFFSFQPRRPSGTKLWEKVKATPNYFKLIIKPRINRVFPCTSNPVENQAIPQFLADIKEKKYLNWNFESMNFRERNRGKHTFPNSKFNYKYSYGLKKQMKGLGHQLNFPRASRLAKLGCNCASNELKLF